MNFLRNHIAFRAIWFLLALYFLNISVDTPDAQPESVPEDLRVNDMESIVEVILEQVFGIANAVPEYDDHDDDHGGLVLKKAFDPVYFPRPSLVIPVGSTSTMLLAVFDDQGPKCLWPEPTPPPPWA